MAVACGGEGYDADSGGSVLSTGQELSSWDGVAFWPRNATTQRYDINVCFFGDTDAVTRQRSENALTGSWESSSAVDFIFQGTCPATPSSSWLPIHLNRVSGTGRSGGLCVGGNGARIQGQQYQCQVTYSSVMENFEAVLVHEVGHGLAMRHEHGRSDWPGRSLGLWVNPPPSPGTTRDAWVCDWHPNGAEPPYWWVSRTGEWCVPYLGRSRSIMAPWRCDVTRRDPDPAVEIGPNYWWPSNSDRLGVEIRTHSFAPASRGRSGFIAASQLVVRTTDTIVPAWSHRGATNNVFASTLWRFGASSLSGLTLPVSSLGAGTHSVRLTFTDPYSRAHDGTTTVRVDDSLHTALALALPVISAWGGLWSSG